MTAENFFASVQYNDLKGTVAADVADSGGPKAWLRQKGYIGEGEFLAGITVWTGEHHGAYRDPMAVEFLIAQGNHDGIQADLKSGSPLSVRSLSIEMPMAEFLGLFKRFAISLSPHGMLEGQTFRRSDDERS